MNTQPPKFKIGDRVTYDNFPGPQAPVGIVQDASMEPTGIDTMLEVAFPEESI